MPPSVLGRCGPSTRHEQVYGNKNDVGAEQLEKLLPPGLHQHNHVVTKNARQIAVVSGEKCSAEGCGCHFVASGICYYSRPNSVTIFISLPFVFFKTFINWTLYCLRGPAGRLHSDFYFLQLLTVKMK